MTADTPRRAGAGIRWQRRQGSAHVTSQASPPATRVGVDEFYDTISETNDRPSTPMSRNTRRQPSPAGSTRSDEHSLGSMETKPAGVKAAQSSNQIHRLSPDGRHATPPNANSPNALRTLRRFRANRQRVPGGAAAKLIGRSEHEVQVSNSYDDGGPVEVVAPTAELDQLREQSKNEFTVGTTMNRRYHTPPRDFRNPGIHHAGIERTMSEASIPSILNRSEVFHQTATAAVLSLLNPRTPRGEHAVNDGSSVASARSHDFSYQHDSLPRVSAFQKPKRDDDVVSVVSMQSNAYVEASFENVARSPIEKPLLTDKAEKRVEELPVAMKDPSKKLSDLLAAIATPENGDLHRGYMVRRKNACGALQVITAKKIHRVKICFTVGVLPALTSVLEDSGDEDLESQFPDVRTRNEFIDARKRAIASLMNLSAPQENRLAVFHSPRLVPGLVLVINQNHDEACRGCCAVLAYLAKTVENRILMVQVQGLLDAITSVIKPRNLLSNESTTRRIVRRSKLREENDHDNTDDDDDDNSETSAYASENIYSIATTGSEGSAGVTDFSQEKTERFSTVDRKSPIPVPYDDDPNEFIHGARQNVFAMLSHIVKEKDNAFHLARHRFLTDTLVEISQLHDSPSHALAIKILANLTRHRANSKVLVFQMHNVVPALIAATYSGNGESRKFACFALQNLAQDKPCRQELAVVPNLLNALCVRARQATDEEERLAVIHALKNLTDEPANLIAMTNTPECFATLMQIAHASDDSVTELMQYLGCDALATLSHWFRNIATSGQRLEAMKIQEQPSKDLFVPTLKLVTWEQWH